MISSIAWPGRGKGQELRLTGLENGEDNKLQKLLEAQWRILGRQMARKLWTVVANKNFNEGENYQNFYQKPFPPSLPSLLVPSFPPSLLSSQLHIQ